jgi:hypothetical protein
MKNINISEGEYFPFYFIYIEGVEDNDEYGGYTERDKIEITDDEFNGLKHFLKDFDKWHNFLKEKFKEK